MTRETGMGPLEQEVAQQEHFDTEKIKEQWAAFTSQLLELLPENEVLRRILVGYAAIPLSETLSQEFLQRALVVVDHEPLLSILQKAEEKLGGYLSLPPIDLERVDKDIANSRGLLWEERELIDTRFQMARLIKRLALGAELLENREVIFDKSGRLSLPSGISIAVNPGKAALVNDVCAPTNWTANRQIKDRVYGVETKTGSYILKERKTRFHTDTKEKGHIDGLTSEQEFATARFLEIVKPKRQGNVEVTWERPIGHVQYPDGYSFVVFEKEDDFIVDDGRMRSQKSVVALYAEAMKESQNPEYLEEYAMVERIASNVGLHSPDQMPVTFPAGKRGPITLDDYFNAKALFDIKVGRFLYEEALIGHGLQNTDKDGLAYRVYSGNKREPAQLEVLAFDLEYYRPTIEYEDRPAAIQNHRTRFFLFEAEMLAFQCQTVQETLVYLALLQIHFPDEFERACNMIRERKTRVGR